MILTLTLISIFSERRHIFYTKAHHIRTRIHRDLNVVDIGTVEMSLFVIVELIEWNVIDQGDHNLRIIFYSMNISIRYYIPVFERWYIIDVDVYPWRASWHLRLFTSPVRSSLKAINTAATDLSPSSHRCQDPHRLHFHLHNPSVSEPRWWPHCER